MNLTVLLGSLAAVLAVVAISWLMGLGRTPRIASEADARQLARDAHSGFRPIGAAVSRDGKAALVAGQGDEYVLLRDHGANLAARVLHGAPPIHRDGTLLIVESGERMFGDLHLELEDEADQHWATQLAPETGAIAHG